MGQATVLEADINNYREQLAENKSQHMEKTKREMMMRKIKPIC